MAKKQKVRYAVMRHMTEDEIRGVGSSRWIERWHSWIWIALILASGLLSLWVGVRWEINGWGEHLLSIPTIIFFVIWLVLYLRSGSKFWRKVKDTPQPFDLDEK